MAQDYHAELTRMTTRDGLEESNRAFQLAYNAQARCFVIGLSCFSPAPCADMSASSAVGVFAPAAD